jgi:integrase
MCASLADKSNSYRHILHAALARLLMENGRLELVARIPHLRAAMPREIVVPEEEFERLLLAVPASVGLALLLAHEAGLRSKTALQLTKANCDFDNHRIMGTTKGGGKYDVPMTHRLREKLLWFAAATNSADEPLTAALRPDHQPMSLNALRTAISVGRKKAGLTSCWSMHDLRRTVARKLYVSTGDIRKVQSFLGHRMLWTTCWYLGNALQNLDSEMLEKALENKSVRERKEATA